MNTDKKKFKVTMFVDGNEVCNAETTEDQVKNLDNLLTTVGRFAAFHKFNMQYHIEEVEE